MDEGVVERREDVRDTEDELALRNLGAERDGVFLLGRLNLLGGLHPMVSLPIHPKGVRFAARREHQRVGSAWRDAHHCDELVGCLEGGCLRTVRRKTNECQRRFRYTEVGATIIARDLYIAPSTWGTRRDPQ